MEITSYFEYELAPYPMTLFKNGQMRPAIKSKLKDFLLTNVSPVTMKNSDKAVRIMDGGALLFVCDWKKGQIFYNILEV